MFKRITLFLLTNFAIIIVFSIVINLLGIQPFLTQQYGLDLGNLLAFCAVFGFLGSFISLAMSKWSAKFATGAQVLASPRNNDEIWLMETVRHHAQKAGIGMPEVAIFPSNDMNAFATGMFRNSALVAVSTGLLQRMDRNEIEAVLGHEISHVANGDMITLSLIQGILNTFVMFFARVVGYVVDKAVFKNDRPGIGYFATTIVCEIVFGILAMMIVMWFSRRREFRADAGGARLTSKEDMIAALQRLEQAQDINLPGQLNAFGIHGKKSGLSQLFMSHPPLQERINALKTQR